jgi:hypothetical protein
MPCGYEWAAAVEASQDRLRYLYRALKIMIAPLAEF